MAERDNEGTIKSFFDSVKTHIEERVSSPLLLSFLISWVIWNHKYILVILSSTDIDKKLMLAGEFFHGRIHGAGYGFAFPLISAVLFLLIYPFPAAWIYGFWYEHQIKLNDLRNKIEKSKLLTLEQSIKIQKENAELRAANSELRLDVIQFRSERDALESSIRDRQVESSNNSTPSPLSKDLNESLIALIKVLAQYGNEIPISTVLKSFPGVNPTRVQYLIDEGRNQSLVGQSGSLVSLTQSGRKYAVESGLVS